MIVVADTSPLNYLLQIDRVHLLPALYSQVALPLSVVEELRHEGSPLVVREWSRDPPQWVSVYQPRARAQRLPTGLGMGEVDAIDLARELFAELLLIDDEKGRKFAEQMGIKATGTLGVLLRAGKRKLVDPVECFKRLTAETNFHSSAAVAERFLGIAGELAD